MRLSKNTAVPFLLAAFLLAALSACGQTKTQDYYMSHPDELAADLADCRKASMHTFNCNEADKAALLLQKKN